MKRLSRAIAVALLCLLAAPLLAQKKLTIEEIFSDPGLTGRMPEQMKWSPDGRKLTFILRDDSGNRGDLLTVDAATGEKQVLVSHEQLASLAPTVEKAVKDERERERLRRYSVASYLWSPDGKAILFTSAGKMYLYDLEAKSARPALRDSGLPEPGQGAGDPKFSPDGKWISFISRHDIWVAPIAGGEARQVTQGGNENVLHGDLDWVYPEELDVRTGYHWSPDSRSIAFLELDEHPVATFPIVDYVPLLAGVDFQKYPKAGSPNPKPRVGIADVASGKTVWLDRVAEYIPRIDWIDSERVAVQLLNRAQTELELVFADTGTGRSKSVLMERDPHWLNVHDDFRFFKGSGEFLWTSERTGFRHIYLYRQDGTLVRALTSGDWEVARVVGVNGWPSYVYFTASERGPLRNDLYRVKLDGKGFERMTERKGSHGIVINQQATAYAETFSSLTTPPGIALRDLAGNKMTPVHAARSLQEYGLAVPDVVALTMPDGAAARGMLIKPAGFDPAKKYPVVIHIYGGPHAPVIGDRWGGTNFLWHQFMAQQGFVVFYFDDRSSAIPGHKYEVALHRQFGSVELKDHLEGVKYLKSLPYVDGERIGLWGWSGGGYTTCFNMLHAPEVFKVGVAVAPVTDWRDYDTIYTERYMGLPQENEAAYRSSSPVHFAANLRGKLLLVHGASDDNVHMQNSLQLAQELIKAGKQFDLLLYPQKTHSISGPVARRHLFTAITEYFKKNL